MIGMLVWTMQRIFACVGALSMSINNMYIMWMWLGEWFVAELHAWVYTGVMGIVVVAAAVLCFVGFIPSKEVYVHRIVRHYSMGWAYLVSFDRAAAQFL